MKPAHKKQIGENGADFLECCGVKMPRWFMLSSTCKFSSVDICSSIPKHFFQVRFSKDEGTRLFCIKVLSSAFFIRCDQRQSVLAAHHHHSIITFHLLLLVLLLTLVLLVYYCCDHYYNDSQPNCHYHPCYYYISILLLLSPLL